MKAKPRVAVLGANGQVGAELCLLLAHRKDLELVPICRNRSGSAFLRWMGIPCRHGRPADAQDGSRLLADCDVVVNSALASGTPADIRNTEDRIVGNAFSYSRPGASIIHFSTQNVYGDPRPGRLIRWRSPYGRVKSATERRVRRDQRRWGKPAFLFRLGHVCGALQNISLNMRNEICQGTFVLPEHDYLSNTVFTVTIVDAICAAIAGTVQPATYDLMNIPQWTWKEVYTYEAQELNVTMAPQYAPVVPRSTFAQRVNRKVLSGLGAIASHPMVHQHGSKLMAYLPSAINRRAQAWWNLRRARTEIAALNLAPQPAEYLSWVANGDKFIRGLSHTEELLKARPYSKILEPNSHPWPPDLPDADLCAVAQVRRSIERKVARTSS